MLSLLIPPRPVFLRVQRTRTRLFSSSCNRLVNRAIVYGQNGNPTDVLNVISYPSLPTPNPGTLNIRFLLSPINPADINVIEGMYPSKPSLVKIKTLTESGSGSGNKGSQDEPVYIGGNEGLGTVTCIGDNVEGIKIGDWVVMVKQQVGTWLSSRNVDVKDVVRITNREGLNEVDVATITVNPPTAYNMLKEFVELKEGDWVMQNGANSAVGQAVIQIAAARGIKTLNFVRNRENLSELKEHLKSLGATEVLTYDDLFDKTVSQKIKSLTDGKMTRLGLNCVGGKETSMMIRYLGKDASLVSYGAMSKQPLSLPTSAFIFKNLTAHGFWQSRWYLDHSIEEREELMRSLSKLISQNKLRAPEHEIVSIGEHTSDDEATTKIREVFQKLTAGRFGKKVLLKFD